MTKSTTVKKSTAKAWPQIISNRELADEAIRIATLIADRMLEEDNLANCIDQMHERAANSNVPIRWDGFGLMQGFCGLAAMYYQLDRCLPKQGWRRVGTHFLKIAAEIYMQPDNISEPSLCSGSSGLGYVALQSPGSSARQMVLNHVTANLQAGLPAIVESMSNAKGLSEGQYDALYGITGITRYLIECESKKLSDAGLSQLLNALISRSGIIDGLAGLYTPWNLLHPLEQREFNNDIVNCGLAHGVPGPLAVLSVALKRGYKYEGLGAAVEFWSKWLIEQIIHDQWGINWPGAVPAKPSAADQATPTRCAWCYGAPGVARSLYLAADALGDTDMKQLACQAMLAVFKRPLEVQRNHSATFCHGRSGLLQITLRFYADTQQEEFLIQAEALCKELVELFDETNIWGYQDDGPDGSKVDNPGLLTGAAGIALPLLAAAMPVEPVWDQVFLLS